MNLTPIDISTRPTSTSALETTPTATEKAVKNTAAEFGAVMNTLLAEHSGSDPSPALSEATQDLLAPTEALTEEALADMLNLTPGLVTVGEPLVLTAVHLGPHMQVITPQTAAPEGQSLEVFARSQGLDETALQWLMGKTSAIIPSGTVATPPPGPTSIGPKDLANLGLTWPNPSGTLSPAAVTSELSKTLMTPEPIRPNTPGTVSTSAAPLEGGMQKINTFLTQASEPASGPLEITVMKFQPATDLTKSPAPWAAASTSASEWLQGNTLAAQLIKPHVSSKLETTPIHLDLSALMTADMQGSLESMAMDGFASGQDSPSQGQGHFNAQADAKLVQRTEATSNSLAMTEQDSAQRRENISNLAERMGQAVGERILSELERGQWHLKLSLRPATLGYIEVEMRMRSGEMDAVFTAAQALTRELLNEGMSKLKDTLNQMGMDVASLKVDDGQSRQRGGESTPERQAQLKDNAPSESADAPVPSSVTATQKMGADGWDVLV
ncbi:flagellar hook-length control protein FliK [Limnohabitans sp.]|uniref:flagellar hook-length control protein FliK n=1 Tax=Limnohabitans sp. TaxID=1907725 RepID=UPI00333FDA46